MAKYFTATEVVDFICDNFSDSESKQKLAENIAIEASELKSY